MIRGCRAQERTWGGVPSSGTAFAESNLPPKPALAPTPCKTTRCVYTYGGSYREGRDRRTTLALRAETLAATRQMPYPERSP